MKKKHFTSLPGKVFFLFPLLPALSTLAFAALFGGCSSVEEPPKVPAVLSVSKAVASPGDTLIIRGKDFATPPSENRIVFNNTLGVAVPYAAFPEKIYIVVPDNAASGPMWVESEGVKSNKVAMEIARGVGDVWVAGGVGNPYSFKVDSESGNESYLVIPHSAREAALLFSYTVTPGTTSSYPLLAPGAIGRGTTLPLQERLEAEILRLSGDYIRTHYRYPQPPRRKALAQVVPDTLTFYVSKTTEGDITDPANFEEVRARLRYTGSRCYIYSDLNSPQGGFVQADYDTFGTQFDEGIFPTNSTYFGVPSDIDGNGHVVILFTPVVNQLTPPGTAQQEGFIAGFFFANDLLESSPQGNGLPPGTTNEMEIFYVMVPDPNREYGNLFTVDLVRDIAPKIFAHEFEHMISISYRLFHYGGMYLQALWLEEGMAHMAEDLNGMNGDNVKRANLYLGDPASASLLVDDNLEQRGAAYLFLRYVGDQMGNSVYRNILQSSRVGTDCIESVTGEKFFFTFADWLATLYLSGRGITPDPRYSYSSINLLQDFAALSVTSRRLSQGAFGGAIRNASGAFFVLSGLSPPALKLTASAASSLGKFRLVVARIQ